MRKHLVSMTVALSVLGGVLLATNSTSIRARPASVSITDFLTPTSTPISEPAREELRLQPLVVNGDQTCGPFIDNETNTYPCGTYGNCTWWAAYKRDIIGQDAWGDASYWLGAADNNGQDFAVCSRAKTQCNPLPGAIAWWSAGHVAFVEKVNPLRVSEMNWFAPGPNYPPDNPTVWVNLGIDPPLHSEQPDGYIYGLQFDPVTLYDSPGFFDGSIFRYADPTTHHNLPYWIDNKVSSVRVARSWAVKLYEDIDEGGGCLLLDENDLDFSNNSFNNGHPVDNNISSAQVFYGLCPSQCPGAIFSANGPATKSSGICGSPPPPSNDGATLVGTMSGVVASAGQSVNLSWHMQNTGTTTWGSGYKLKFISGEQMNGPSEVDFSATEPGGVVGIGVNLVAPNGPGDHVGYWRMWSPNQQGFFGPEVQVVITVKDDSQPPQAGDVILTCSNCPDVVTPGQQFRPIIQANIRTGALLQSRGDMLLATSNPNYTYQEFPHIGVVGNHYAGETYTFQFYADHPVAAPTAEGTYESRWRVWRNNNWAGDELVIRFIVRNGGGTLPNVPTLSSPADGWTDFLGCQTLPQLSVQPQGAGIQFYFQVDPSAPQNSGWVNGPSWTPSSLGQTEHIWRVKARDASTLLESDWSSQRRFTCSSTNYSIPYMLFSPSSPTSVDRVKIWTCADVPSEVGRGIEVYANTATDGTNSGEWRRVWPVLNGDCTADWQNHPEWWPEEDLRFLSDGAHLIQARAWAGPRDNPIKSMVREATYTLNPDRRPAQVRQLSPEAQQWLNTRTITFRWEPEEVLRSQSFVLKVSTDPNPAVNPIVNQAVSSTDKAFTYTLGQDYQALYWGIQACNSYGCSDMGSVRFGIDRLPPSSLVSTLPITIYDTVQNVTWSCTDNASGCQRYDVQVRDDVLGQWQDWRSGVTEISGLFNGLPGHHYCFRVRALDNAASLESWPSNPNGDTCTLIDLDNQPYAWWNANYGFKRNITLLNTDGHTLNAGFPIHVHFDDTTPTTAAEIYNGSTAATKGDDVRVIYQNATEVSRFVQTFTPQAIDIWFDVQADVGPNPASSADYQLYYGNPAATNPPANPGDVFMPRRDSGVVASWYLSEWGGSIAADNSGNSHTATRVNGGQWVTTVRGPAIDLVKDSKQYLMVNDPASLNLSTFTFEAWFWRDHSDVGALISKWRDGEDDSSYLFGIWQRKMMLRLRSPSGQFFETPEGEQPNINFQDNVGYHVATTYDGSTVRFYVNGELKYTKDWTGGVRNSSKNVFLGVQQSPTGDPPYSLDGYFDGLLGGVRISNYARTSFPYASFALVNNAPQVSAGAEVAYESPTIQPDLAILSLTTYPASVSQGGGLIAQAVVKNQGTRATRNGAWTLAYADHQPTIGDLNGISFWLGTPIQAGAIATLTTYITSTNALGLMAASADQALAESDHTLYVQADATGVTKDSNRANNISTGAQVCLANADAFEPNDTITNAVTLALGLTTPLNFHGTEDQDWVKFTAPKGVTLTLQTSDLGTAADTYLYLYGTDGITLVAANDDYDGSLASRIDWAAPITGTYYVMVRGWNPNVGGCGTGYSLSIAPTVRISHVYLPVILGNFDSRTVRANFSASPTIGRAPLAVGFIDQSSGPVLGRLWSFGDGITSTAQNPLHTYIAIGTYTVSLRLSGPIGNDTLIKTNYIVVSGVPTILYVAPNGSDAANDCGNSANPCATVQYAVDTANPGNEIRVAAGVYTGVSARPRNDVIASGVVTQVVYVSKTVTIQGGYTALNWTEPHPDTQPSTLEAGGRGRVLYITGNISPAIVGLNITGGNADRLGGNSSGEDGGGGIYVFHAAVTISDCAIFNNSASYGAGTYLFDSPANLSGNIIHSNAASWDGGGLFVYANSPHLSQNTLISNTAADVGGAVHIVASSANVKGNRILANEASRGGGLWLSSSNTILDGNTIVSNTAQWDGGGLYLWLGTDTVINNVIADNHTDYRSGSGVYLEGASSRLLHNTIARNTGGNGAGVQVADSWGNPSTARITNTIIVSQLIGINVTNGNTATVNSVLWFGNGSNVGGGGIVAVTNAYTGTPAFAVDGYHLTLSSLAIDKGVSAGVTTDIDSQARPYGAAPDLGADEYIPAHTLRRTDFNEGRSPQMRTPMILLLLGFTYPMLNGISKIQ